MNASLKAYQMLQKAAKAVQEGKPGAKTKLNAASKRYTDLVAKNAKKEAETKIKESRARAAKIGSVKAKPKAAAKKKTATTTKKKATSARRTSRSTTTKKRR